MTFTLKTSMKGSQSGQSTEKATRRPGMERQRGRERIVGELLLPQEVRKQGIKMYGEKEST